MAIWPFSRRNKVEADVPTEIRDYYDAERRERRGIAWLLGIGTLLVTVALAVLLFFGGRWLFRTIFDDNNSNDVAQNEPAPTSQENTGDQEITPEPTPAPSPPTEQPTPPPPAPSPAPTPSPTPAPAATPTPAPSPTPTPPAANPPSPAPTPPNGNIPNTGPTETIAVFVAVTVLATVGHNLYTRRQLGN